MLNPSPSTRLWRLLGRFTRSKLWLNHVKPIAKYQALKAAWKVHSFQALVKPISKSQALKTAWQGHSFEALVKPVAECQALKAAWQVHSFQALIKPVAECQALKAAWQGHSFQALVKGIAKCQTLKTSWQRHLFQALVKVTAKCQVFKALWEMVQILRGCCTHDQRVLYPRDSLQCKLPLGDWQTLDGTPCSIEICWDISARERSSLTYNALLLQCFVQYQRRIKVMQGEYRTFLQRKLLWNHLVHFPASTGTIELQRASFTIQALNRKVNRVCLTTWHYTRTITAGHELLGSAGPSIACLTWMKWPLWIQVKEIWRKFPPEKYMKHGNWWICLWFFHIGNRVMNVHITTSANWTNAQPHLWIGLAAGIHQRLWNYILIFRDAKQSYGAASNKQFNMCSNILSTYSNFSRFYTPQHI